MNMFLLAQAASPDPMAAMLGSPTFKSLATYLLIGIAILALFYPALLAKLKAGLVSIIDKQLVDKLPTLGGGGLPAPPFSPFGAASGQPPQVAVQPASKPTGDINQLIQQRAAELKAACPRASDALRLKWLDAGFDISQAKTDYIAVLEGQAGTQSPQSPTPPTA